MKRSLAEMTLLGWQFFAHTVEAVHVVEQYEYEGYKIKKSDAFMAGVGASSFLLLLILCCSSRYSEAKKADQYQKIKIKINYKPQIKEEL